jgi:hypothetical protein
MISVAEVVLDPDLAENFTVNRLTGSFQLGGWVQTSTTIQFYGIVTVASNKDLQMIPEGDRVTGSMLFHSTERMYLTELDTGTYSPSMCTPATGIPEQHISDQISWRGQLFRIISVAPWADFGYWRAIGVRMSGV